MLKRNILLFFISVLTIVMLSGSVTATPLEDDVNLSIAKAFNVSAEQFDEEDTPWRIFHKLVNEKAETKYLGGNISW